MPHIVVLYTGNLDRPSPGGLQADLDGLCRRLADTLLAVRDETGTPVFPPGGVRVLAFPAPHFAVADGSVDAAFVYLHLRMGRGRSEAVRQRTGEALRASAAAHFEPLLAARAVGITLQIDEGPEVYDAKLGNLHARFAKGR